MSATKEDLGSKLAAIKGAKLVLTNRLIAATRPLDASGADEIIETGAAAHNDNETPDSDTAED